ncbi:cation:proton antiporter [Pseudomonas typographi]|uniref:Sodium:proton antiporter n=1 Tax=Pseudomonas typographi TaxID=2715964 RepID=A0ABR7Z5V7_9PSED|nr:cation:proton antiporter [Pseudomonas typographi]MBD1554175.1 sodium:proton antiporter [Pseudomonas typographi]MBD1589463.1 sodium:proton antiporter [Pseudomonas typographi]MBD1600681.1 sodium:proton antiporter [Pseudomonas typographi]
MSFILCLSVMGVLLLMLALASAYLRWLPVTTSAVCLAFGFAIGPAGLGLVNLEIVSASPWLERLAEVAVLFSLFGTGIKLRLGFQRSAWRAAYCLAGPVMIASIFGVAAVAHYLLGLDWGLALLVGAMLAPTDPVLANMVQVSSAQDADRLRFGLSGEAGLNDGTAFPFVLLSLLLIEHGGWDSQWLTGWLLRDVLWAVPVGLGTGYGLGWLIGYWMINLRVRHDDSTLSPNDFLALALIAVAYVVAYALDAYAFLAVFAAGLGVRQAEARLSDSEVPSEHLTQPVLGHHEKPVEEATVADVDTLEKPQLAAGVMMGDMLAFGSLVERAMEVALITLLGALLWRYWAWPAVILGAALFCVIRPLMVWLLGGSRRLLSSHQRALLGWFGIRGIGSLYYLCFALNHHLPSAATQVVVPLTLTVVGLSIVVHGLSVQPLLDHYRRRTERAGT